MVLHHDCRFHKVFLRHINRILVLLLLVYAVARTAVQLSAWNPPVLPCLGVVSKVTRSSMHSVVMPCPPLTLSTVAGVRLFG